MKEQRKAEKIPQVLGRAEFTNNTDVSSDVLSFLTEADQSLLENSPLKISSLKNEGRKKTVRMADNVVLLSESGAAEMVEMKENANPESKLGRKTKGKKIIAQTTVAKPEFDTSLDDECKQQ